MDEVIIVINGSRDGSIIIIPLRSRNFSIFVFVTEVGQELEEDFILSHFTRDNLRVEAAIIGSLKISGFNGTVSILIEFQESLIDESLSFLVEFAL